MVYRTTSRGMALREASKSRILAAAAALFATKGYDATTMQDIVRKARTSIGNAYFYFHNKEAVMRAVLESAFLRIFDANEKRSGHIPDGPERVGAIIALNVTSMLTARREMLDVLLADSRVSLVQELGDLSVGRWIRLLSLGFPERDRRELELVAAAIWGVNRATVERVARGQLRLETKEIVAFLVRWTLRALDVAPKRIDSIINSSWRLALRNAREMETRTW